MRRQLQVVLLVLGACATPGCHIAEVAGPPDEGDVCQQAVAHIAECTGMQPVAAVAACDPQVAQAVLAQDCAETQRSMQSKSGGWWDSLLCTFGFSSHCDGAENPEVPTRATPTPFPSGAVDLTTYRADAYTQDKFRATFDPNRYSEYSSTLEQEIVPMLPELSPVPIVELVAIRGYTSDVPKGSSQVPDYRQINQALRQQDPAELTRLEPYIKCASSGLNQLPQYIGTVYRGTTLPEAVVATYSQGITVTERAFTSSSVVLLGEFKGNTTFIILSRRGREISKLSVFPSEGEVLFVPGTRFRVLTVESAATGTTIYLDEVQ